MAEQAHDQRSNAVPISSTAKADAEVFGSKFISQLVSDITKLNTLSKGRLEHHRNLEAVITQALEDVKEGEVSKVQKALVFSWGEFTKIAKGYLKDTPKDALDAKQKALKGTGKEINAVTTLKNLQERYDAFTEMKKLYDGICNGIETAKKEHAKTKETVNIKGDDSQVRTLFGEYRPVSRGNIAQVLKDRSPLRMDLTFANSKDPVRCDVSIEQITKGESGYKISVEIQLPEKLKALSTSPVIKKTYLLGKLVEYAQDNRLFYKPK